MHPKFAQGHPLPWANKKLMWKLITLSIQPTFLFFNPDTHLEGVCTMPL